MNREPDLTRLLAEDGLLDKAERERRMRAMQQVIENERRFVNRLRLVSVAAWAMTLLIPMAGILAAVAWTTDNLESLSIPIAMFGILGGLSLVLAVICTMAWLFRSRTSTLAAIELHLAKLEDAVRAR